MLLAMKAIGGGGRDKEFAVHDIIMGLVAQNNSNTRIQAAIIRSLLSTIPWRAAVARNRAERTRVHAVILHVHKHAGFTYNMYIKFV